MSLLKNYIEPKTMAEAESRLQELSEKLREIEVQLGNRNRIDPRTGNRLGEEEYFAWRSKAQWAQQSMMSERSRIKLWIKEQREHSAMQRLGGIDPQSIDWDNSNHILWITYRALLTVAQRGGLRDDESTALDVARRYLETHPDQPRVIRNRKRLGREIKHSEMVEHGI